MFPRIGDTFVSVDKMMDLVTWEGIYKLMQKVTTDFDSWVEGDQSIINYMRYEIQVRKIKLDVPYKNLVDVNFELLHRDYIMCMYVSLNNDGENLIRVSTAVSTNCDTASASVPASATIKNTPKTNGETSHEENNFGKSSGQTQRKRANANDIDNLSIKRQTKAPSVVNYNGIKIPQNFEQLREQMKDAAVLARFGFDNINNDRFFDNVYTLRDGRCFSAFQNSFIVENMRREGEVELFFCFSPELLEQFKGIGFEDLSETLIVYVLLFDQVFPFGYFILSNHVRHVLEDVILVIVKWFNGTSNAGQACNPPDVTKCVVPQDRDLHFAIRKYWPNVKLIGCSAQYQREVCDFIFKKRTPVDNPDSFYKDKKKLINFARSLCYLPEKYISIGIDVIEGIEIEHEKLFPCKMQLVENLYSKWQEHSISVFNEKCVYRTLQVCTQFNIQIKRELKSEHIWKSIEMLKALNARVELEFRECIRVPTGFRLNAKMNTPNQKKREVVFWTATEEFEKDLKIMLPDEAIKIYMEKFFEN